MYMIPVREERLNNGISILTVTDIIVDSNSR